MCAVQRWYQQRRTSPGMLKSKLLDIFLHTERCPHRELAQMGVWQMTELDSPRPPTNFEAVPVRGQGSLLLQETLFEYDMIVQPAGYG